MRKHTIFAAIAALALAACAMPPYNERLSLAQVTMSKLGAPVLKIGPVYSRLDGDSSRNRYYFLPDRNDPVIGGFLVGERSYGLDIWFVPNYFSYSNLGSSKFMPIDNANDTSNNFLLQAIESFTVGTTYNLNLARYASPYYDLKLLRSTDVDPMNVTEPSTVSLSSTLGVTYILGGSIFADTTAGSDPLYFLGSLGTASYQEFPCRTNSTGGLTYTATYASAITPLGLVPDDLTSAFYTHNPSNDRSYLSYPAGSSYATWSWLWDESTAAAAPTGFQQLAGVKGRVEAVLSNWQLLAIDGNTCTMYDEIGGKLYDFPLGGLKFCYERYDSTSLQYMAYFSLAYWHWGRDEESDKLYVEVYAVPTAELQKLQ